MVISSILLLLSADVTVAALLLNAEQHVMDSFYCLLDCMLQLTTAAGDCSSVFSNWLLLSVAECFCS